MMRIRPRYSLLTLLVLTALVAGGVKLWYGPHHVVEPAKYTNDELEYTFTRNWKGHKKIQGLWVKRTIDRQGNFASALITYFRNDIRVLHPENQNGLSPWGYVICIEGGPFLPELLQQKISRNPLTAEEQQEFQKCIDEERERLRRTHPQGRFIEGYMIP